MLLLIFVYSAAYAPVSIDLYMGQLYIHVLVWALFGTTGCVIIVYADSTHDYNTIDRTATKWAHLEWLTIVAE